MTSERIKEIQECTAYPSSKSVQLALLQVWNECAQQSQIEIDELNRAVDNLMKARHELQEEVERLRSIVDSYETAKTMQKPLPPINH